MRVSIRQIPNIPTPCSLAKPCVYRDAYGVCDEPRINKGNGDAACHRVNNKDLLKTLSCLREEPLAERIETAHE